MVNEDLKENVRKLLELKYTIDIGMLKPSFPLAGKRLDLELMQPKYNFMPVVDRQRAYKSLMKEILEDL